MKKFTVERAASLLSMKKKCIGVKARWWHDFTHDRLHLKSPVYRKTLPEYIEVDVEELMLGDTMHMSDIKLPEGVVIVELTHGEDHDHQSVVAINAESCRSRS